MSYPAQRQPVSRRISPKRSDRRAAQSLRRAVLPLLGLTGALSSVAGAGPTWIGQGASDLWSTPANWNANTLPPNNGSAGLVFDGFLRTAPDMDANWAINALSFAAGASGFTLGSTGNFTLTVGAGGITNSSTRTQVIDTLVTMTAPQTWNALARISLDRNVNLGAHQLTIDGVQTVRAGGVVSGAGSIRKNGSGTLVLEGSASNAFNGGVSVNSGTLWLNKTNARAMSSGALTVGDGVGGADADVVFINAASQFASNVALSVQPSGLVVGNNLLNPVGSITMTGGRIASPYLRVMGNITSHASSTTATIGAGTIDFFSQTRTLDVADGPAAVDLDIAAGFVNGEVIKAGAGALRLAGAGTFDGGFTQGGGTLVLAHDNALGGATFTFAGGTLRGDGASRTIANAVSLTGPATVDGPASLTFNGPVSGAALLTKNGSGTLTIGGATSNTNAGGVTVNAGTLVFAKATPAVAVGAGTVVVNGGGALLLAAANQFAVGATLDARGAGVVYGNNQLNTLTTLTMTGGRIEQPHLRTTGVVVNASTETARINSGTLDLANGVRTFSVADGAAPIDINVTAHLSNGGINKTGPGAMRIGGVSDAALGTTVNAGTLILAHPRSADAAMLSVGAGGSAVVEIGLPSALLLRAAPAITAPGTLDLTDNDVVIDYDAASPVATLRSTLHAGGIVTSAVATDAAVGFAEATDLFTAFPATFAGQTIDDTSVLLCVTRRGDANLDGAVNLQDFNRLAANFGATGSARWSQGDFNYDGNVNLIDFNLLAGNFGQTAGGTLSPEDWSTLAAAVPEPGGLIVGLSVIASLRRRRTPR